MLIATLFYRENRDGAWEVLEDLGGGADAEPAGEPGASRAWASGADRQRQAGQRAGLHLSGMVNWKQVESLGPQFAPRRSLVAASGPREPSTWQATPKDLFQAQRLRQPEGLTAAGDALAGGGVDLGYRHKLTDKLFVLVTLQDIS